jgi:hypothetical protein
MAGNRFTERPDADDEFPNEINQREVITKYLLEEFPNDPVLKEGKLSESDILPTLPVRGLASRSEATSLLEIDADVSASYARYDINKMVPGVDDEELDEILDDEFEFYLDPDDTGFRAPATTGIFLLSVEIDDRPFDYHDTFITSGPENIPAFIANGMDDDTILTSIFTIWFIERDIARPIPNYKTLEVMLVEQGLTYDAIEEASQDQMKEFDMRLDGRFKNYPDEDVDGNPLPRPTIFDEFVAKSVLDRSRRWTPTIRFKSGYEPGESSTGETFLRDPGDYIKPEQLRSQATYIPELDSMVNARRARAIERKRIELLNEFGAVSEDNFRIAFEETFDPLEGADPDDKYFDQAFITTRTERLRSEYEGKLVLLSWPQPDFALDVVENFTDNVLSDDLIFDLRFMIHGHLKQVQSLRTLKEIARINNIDTSNYDAALEELPMGDEGSEEFKAAVEALDLEQYNALKERTGFINMMVQAGGIEVLGEQRVNTGTRPIWDDFGQIAQVDRLDFDEYDQYVTFYSNNLEPFAVKELVPFEPPGSIAYYPAKRYEQLQQQAIAQGQFDAAKKAIEEMFPAVASRAAELAARLSGIQGGFSQQCQDAFGPDSDVQNIIHNNRSGDGRHFRLLKEKNNGKIKEKGKQDGFFKLVEAEGRITRAMNKSSENHMFLADGNVMKAFFINTNDKDSNGRAIDLLAMGENSSGLVLSNNVMADAMKKARVTVTPKWKKDDDGSAGSKKQRYARPERGGSRVRRMMKDNDYAKAGVAQYILEFIIDPRKYPADNKSESLPDDLINGKNTADFYTLCNDADDFMVEVQEDIREISDFIASVDERILLATDIWEILDIEKKLRDGKHLVEDFNDELFTYLESIQDYIITQRKALAQNIVNSIQYVRKKVNDKNDKYYIEWAPANAALAAAYCSVDQDAYKKDK